MFLSTQTLDIVHLRKCICGTTFGWRTYTVILAIWVGGLECGLTATNGLLLSSRALHSSPSTVHWRDTILTRWLLLQPAYIGKHFCRPVLQIYIQASDRAHRFPYPLIITFFQQVLTCPPIWATVGFSRNLSASYIPQTPSLPKTVVHLGTAGKFSKVSAGWLSWELLKYTEGIDAYFSLSTYRQVFPVAVVYTANMILSTWFFRYAVYAQVRPRFW